MLATIYNIVFVSECEHLEGGDVARKAELEKDRPGAAAALHLKGNIFHYPFEVTLNHWREYARQSFASWANSTLNVFDKK